MGDLFNEQRMSLAELARQEKLSACTAWRWASRGVRGVRLETFSVGGRRFTTHEAFRRFVEGTTAAICGQPAPQGRTNRQREAAVRRAEAELAKAGI